MIHLGIFFARFKWNLIKNMIIGCIYKLQSPLKGVSVILTILEVNHKTSQNLLLRRVVMVIPGKWGSDTLPHSLFLNCLPEMRKRFLAEQSWENVMKFTNKFKCWSYICPPGQGKPLTWAHFPWQGGQGLGWNSRGAGAGLELSESEVFK